MADKTIERYSIDLETRVKMSDDSKRALQGVQNSLSSLQEAAGNLDFEKASSTLADIQKTIKNTSADAKQYGIELNKAYNALQKQADKLTYSQTEQGKRERERLLALKAQTELTKNEKKELERLEKRVVALTDTELENNLKQNRALRIQIKSLQGELRLRKTGTQLLKEDLSFITARIKKQKEYIKTLSATGKAYYALKKAGGVVKVGAKAAAGAAGVFAGITAAGMAGASREVEIERAAGRIKASLTDAQKRGIIASLATKTGKDTDEIVSAINRTTTVLGRGASRAQLEAATQVELKMPGAAELFQSQDAGNSANFRLLQGRLEAIQRQTGVEDLSGVMQTVSRLGNFAFSKGATQTDLVALLSALQGAGVFSDAEHQERAVRAFVASLKAGENLFEKAQGFDWARYAGNNAQARNRAINGVSSIDFAGLRLAAETTQKGAGMTTAEKAAMRARQMEEMKNKLIMRVLEITFPIVDKVMRWLDANVDRISLYLSKAFQLLLRIADKVTLGRFPDIALAIENGEKKIADLEQLVAEGDRQRATIEMRQQTALERIQKMQDEGKLDSETARFYRDSAKQTETEEVILELLQNAMSNIETEDPATSLAQRSSGGLLVGKGIVGERGGELVVPMDYARSGRASNLIQNITNTFNMSGTQTTAMSLAGVVGRGFNRRAYADVRMGR